MEWQDDAIVIGIRRLGEADVMIAAGTESMSMLPMGGNKPSFSPTIPTAIRSI